MHKRNPDIDKRCRRLKNGRRGDGPVVYWMSRDQRMENNWALLWAQQEAIARDKGLIVVFCLIPDYLKAHSEHYSFMLNGLKNTKELLQKKSTPFFLFEDQPSNALPRFLKHIDAHILVCDFDPLRIKQQWQESVKTEIAVPLYEVDTHNIIPAWVASDKKEYAAYTFRPKVNRLLDDYLTDIPVFRSHPVNWNISDQSLSSFKIGTKKLNDLATEDQSGETIANEAAKAFIDTRLKSYNTDRNNPCLNGQSGLSPYLHFGHLSAHKLAEMVSAADIPADSKDAFLEELIIRRELADNYCYYEKNYDQFSAFSNWAQQSLNIHRKDKREYVYSFDQFEQSLTHESLWNACQKDLVENKKLHGFLRMYWAKKILEWTPDPETALEYAITLNDRYSMDGRDPNGYAGIAWSIGGVHDRAWKARPVFGKVRYMNEAGCRRKFNVDDYIQSVFVENRKVQSSSAN